MTMPTPFLFGHIVSPIAVAAIFYSLYLVQRRRAAEDQRAREEASAQGLAAPELPLRYPWKRGIAGAMGMAAVYLLIFRLLSLSHPWVDLNKGGPVLMSFAFLFLGPFVAGVITVSQASRKEPWPVRAWILAPWIPILINLLVALAVAWEGLICVIFVVPPALISASLGGVAAGALQRYLHRRISLGPMYCLAALPLFVAMIEAGLHQPLQTRTVHTAITIHAPAPIIWQNIERVPAIAPLELRHSWANAIGFPRPIEATLSHEGVGGVRNASFERGLTFTETVTDWQPLQRLAFTIRANTASIPPTTLDEHVTVGGRFFDVLSGEYRLQPLPNGDTLLHLSSQERLSTDFNAYAALWSDAVMRDMQGNILHVIQHRCETATQQHASR